MTPEPFSESATTRLLADVMASDDPADVAALNASVAAINRPEYISVETDRPHGSYCSACEKLTFPLYTVDEPDGKPRTFTIRYRRHSFILCLDCLTQLEDAANKAIGSAR